MVDDARSSASAYRPLPSSPLQDEDRDPKDSESPRHLEDRELAAPRPVLSNRVRLGIKWIVICGLLYLLVPWADLHDDLQAAHGTPQNPQAKEFSSAPVCAATSPQAPVGLVDSVWTSLSVEEAVKIRAWLFEPAQGFNLTSGEAAEAR